MAGEPFPFRLYLVTDEKACLGRSLLWVVEQAVKGGADLVQLREKDLSDETFRDKAVELKAMLDRYNVPLIINDNLYVAQQSKASGIHVGNTDMPPSHIREKWPQINILGYSIEFETQLNTSEADASDYLALSPIFATPTKTNTITEWKLEGIRKLRTLIDKPIVAIGGIHETNAASVIMAGADCLAVVSAICSAKDPALAAERLRNQIEKVSAHYEKI